MRILAIAAVAFFAIAPAYAAGPDFGDGKKKDEDQKVRAAREAEQDRAYKSSLQRIPPKAAVIDPWGSARETQPSEANTSVQNRPKKPQAAKPVQ
jgi:hypothetical protein